MKQLNVQLLNLTETYQKNVLEITDELEQLGHLPVGHSKDFSKKILDISKLVPPVELEASINNLDTFIKQKLAEMDQKIKNLKPKKKKKAEKKTIKQRYDLLNQEQKEAMQKGMTYCDSTSTGGQSRCCPGFSAIEALSFWPLLYKDEK